MVLLLLLALAQLMVILDISAVNVALPDLAKDLNIAGGDLGWTITSYSLVFGSLLLLGGRAADLLGRRRVFLTGLAVPRSLRCLGWRQAKKSSPPAPDRVSAAMLSPAAVDHHDHFPGPTARRLRSMPRRRRRHRRPAGGRY
jgi:MFS family permease